MTAFLAAIGLLIVVALLALGIRATIKWAINRTGE